MHSALLRLLSVEGFDISAPSKMDFVLAECCCKMVSGLESSV